MITSNYYLPSTPKDQSTTRAELTEYKATEDKELRKGQLSYELSLHVL